MRRIHIHVRSLYLQVMLLEAFITTQKYYQHSLYFSGKQQKTWNAFKQLVVQNSNREQNFERGEANGPMWTTNRSPQRPGGHQPPKDIDVEMQIRFQSQDKRSTDPAVPKTNILRSSRRDQMPDMTEDSSDTDTFQALDMGSSPVGSSFPSTTATAPHLPPPTNLTTSATVGQAPSGLSWHEEKEGARVRHVRWEGFEEDGIYVTWEDLWVTASNAKTGYRAILQGLTGYAQPGEVLAIMGPSGCGKSTLLDALAGRLGSNTRESGEILINGRRQTLAFGTSAYVTQDDTLMTTLTVREAVYYSALLQLPDSMSRQEKRERAETAIKEMGLQDSMNTRIGGWASKGLSGGQKRRVSICIQMLTRPKLLFLDEPTSGLDSAASYHVMNRIVGLARGGGKTVIASIHQPSSEVFELFNSLCLLSAGRTVYFGPASEANEFFAFNGFPCPSMRNPSDHFLRTINKDFDEDIEQGSDRMPAAAVIDILTKSYKSSNNSKQIEQRVEEMRNKGGAPLEKGSQASFLTQSLVLTRRSFVNMYRDLGYYWLRLAIYVALFLCVGTVFHDIGHSYESIQARGSVIVFVASFLTFMAIGGFPSFVEEIKIFERERLNGHYGVGAYVMGNTFSSIPYLLLIAVVPGAIGYFLAGLQRTADHFLYFALVLFACTWLVESLMMTVASVVPDFLMGIITGAGIQGLMILNGGFFRLPKDLPKFFWKYPISYIAFHKYAYQGLYKNEFIGLTFPNNQARGPPIITGEMVLSNVWQVEMSYSKWVNLGILFGMVGVYRVLFFLIIKATEKFKPIIRSHLSVPSRKNLQVVEQPATPTY